MRAFSSCREPAHQLASTASGVFPAMPVRLPTRKICVSTAIVDVQASFSTTLVVLRPTPGSAPAPRGRRKRHRHATRSGSPTDGGRSCLGVEQPDGADAMGNPVNPELDHRLRCIGGGKEPVARLTPASAAPTARRRREAGPIVELGFRLGKHLRHPFETGLDIGEFHLAGAGRSCHRFSALRAALESSGPASRLP